MRLALGVEYDGTHYHGWQRQQQGVISIQERLELALSRVADSEIQVVCAGRTDAGVHALEQVIHLDTQAKRSERGWLLGVNSYLPRDIRIKWVRPVSSDFHARYSATARRYRYLIYADAVASALHWNRAMWLNRPLEITSMQVAARCLLGEHDFSSFRGSGCQSLSKMRRVSLLEVKRKGKLVVIEIQANAFLLHMVRNIVGSLLKVGTGEQPSHWLAEVLKARDRRLAAATAPACGLYLVKVSYPAMFWSNGEGARIN